MSAQPAYVTPYAAAKIVNAALAEAGIDKHIPPQMVYNYTTARVRKGKSPLGGLVMNDEGKVSLDSVQAWASKMITKAKANA